MDRTQDAVFALLGDPRTYGGTEVRRYDTHAASVFLAGDRALKVKRAVRFPFLDYSTLEKRKAACVAELEINRRFAPQLYRRIVPITRETDERLVLDGHGEPVEWAVEMARFDENQTLDLVAGRGELDDDLIGKLAKAVAIMHAAAEPADAVSWLAAIEDYIAQNTAAFLEQNTLLPAASVADLERKSRAALDRLRPLLLTRGQQGLVRRAHGDLHLGNIAVLGTEPVAFDAIEFDPLVASGDLLYDLAFLLMDLIERGLLRSANGVLNGYFAAARRIADCDGLAGLPFFMSLRAAIRAKVTVAKLAQNPAVHRDEIERSARNYFELALELLILGTPSVICIGGLSGTGKSVLARSLAPFVNPKPGALLLRSDVERKVLFGKSETEHLPSDAYRMEVSKRLYAMLINKAGRIARAGHSVIVDAVFAKPSERAAIETVAAKVNVKFRGLFLTADLNTRLKRIGDRGPDASDADVAVAREQEGFVLGAMNWNVVDASGSPERTLSNARATLD